MEDLGKTITMREIDEEFVKQDKARLIAESPVSTFAYVDRDYARAARRRLDKAARKARMALVR